MVFYIVSPCHTIESVWQNQKAKILEKRPTLGKHILAGYFKIVVWYSKGQKMANFTFDAGFQQWSNCHRNS